MEHTGTGDCAHYSERPVFQPAKTQLAALVVVVFAAFFFGYAVLFASGRYFWVDEISTVINASAPDVKALWDSPKHIPDFQTAAFYLLMRVNSALFGNGLVATRIPSI